MTILNSISNLQKLAIEVEKQEKLMPAIWNRFYRGSIMDKRVRRLEHYRNGGKVVFYQDGSSEFVGGVK